MSSSSSSSSSPDTAAAADAPKITFGVESRVALETMGAAIAIAIDTNGIVYSSK